MSDIIIQGIGAVAYLLLVYSYYKKEKTNILFVQIIAQFVFALHYFLLNGLTGAVCNFINGVMMIIIYLYDKKGKKKTSLILILIPVLILIALLSWEDYYSILPIVASTIMLIAFLLNNENHIRLIGVVSNLLWTIYGVVHASIFAIAFEIFSVIGTLIAYLKNANNKKKIS